MTRATEKTPEDAMDCGYGRAPTLAQARMLVDERALSDRLAEALRDSLVAIDALKKKYLAAEGDWAIVDFLSAATDKSHWMHVVVEAERAIPSALAAHDAARADNP